jgi:hypothetical protein
MALQLVRDFLLVQHGKLFNCNTSPQRLLAVCQGVFGVRSNPCADVGNVSVSWKLEALWGLPVPFVS